MNIEIGNYIKVKEPKKNINEIDFSKYYQVKNIYVIDNKPLFNCLFDTKNGIELLQLQLKDIAEVKTLNKVELK